ncbi:MAG: UTP--glucose-1-phosphate uridylyltransferase [Coriobacteriales bacterium]|jgi:UTP--glucose-1-phosphate uridylyltransferase
MIAIIPAAGLGTRFLPMTKAQPKEMLPVIDKPVIQYVVEEALDAGADEVVIVNSREKRSIEEHFSPAPKLVELLRSSGKDAYADVVEAAGNLPVSFVYQDEPLGLGHAILMADEKSGGEPFFILLGDMIVPGGGILERMCDVHEAHGGASVIAVFPVPDGEVSRYGIISGEPVAGEEGVWRVDRLVEKPSRDEAPSNLAIFGRYLLSPLVMELLRTEEPSVGGEIQLTGALDGALAQEEMYAVVIDPSEGFDTGTVPSYLETIVKLALRDESLAPVVKEVIGQ